MQRAPARTRRQRRPFPGKTQLLSMAEALSRLIPNADSCVISVIRHRQPTLAPAPGRSTRVGHEYFREGAWTYLAAWDVHRAKVFGRCEKKSGIAPVDRLIENVMSQEPYKSARRVFWIMDNCSAHRAQRAVDHLRSQSPKLFLVHTPSASWLNQIEIYFSIVQRKVLIPNDFKSLTNSNSGSCSGRGEILHLQLRPNDGPHRAD
jgi:hypothetical protein